MPARFPDINKVARAREQFAQTARRNQLQPGLVTRQNQENTLRGFDIGTAQASVASRESVAAINKRLQDGDPTAFADLARQHPTIATQQLEAVRKNRKLEADTFDRGALQVGRFATAVARTIAAENANPQQAQEIYSRLREVLKSRNKDINDADVPPKLRKGFLETAISFASGVAALQKEAGFAQPKEKNVLTTVGVRGQPGAEQRASVAPDNTLTTLGPPLLAADKSGGGGGGNGLVGGQIKTADSNAIAQAANRIYGDLYGPDGELVITDPQAQIKALRLKARSERIFQRKRAAGQAIAPREAVLQASRELGITKEDFSAGTTTRDQRSSTGTSVDFTGTSQSSPTNPSVRNPVRPTPGQTRAQQKAAFKKFTDGL